ncbi:hypothetical protein BDM02DRAFT_3192473 [Thelephora ganbajun]|uniref:Uncharacterized protein n=1 Tax=Thelephora ganbajun TaxID=370292 RepID=A0ACB6Z041_THEGA|nr:hypothetical protein BDM02DRAFT_3192473 [Thelephora ganbajun]
MVNAISAHVWTLKPSLASYRHRHLDQAWDPSGEEVDSMQLLLQPDNSPDGQVFRLQVTDVPEALSIVTTPQPGSLPLSYTSTELTLPFCGPGADFEDGHQKMTWKAHHVNTIFNFVDFAGGVTLYQEVNMTGLVWVNGSSRAIGGGVGIVEVYHR